MQWGGTVLGAVAKDIPNTGPLPFRPALEEAHK